MTSLEHGNRSVNSHERILICRYVCKPEMMGGGKEYQVSS